jgi:2-polyprenyl-3-methyl-5-hydroxy-6-metoxy-1,4-benzoquinol methylase
MLETDYQQKKQDYYEEYRKDILPLLPKHAARILEVGCGTGNTLVYLKDNNYCDWTCGIELFPEAATIAKDRVDLFFQGNIETFDLPIEPNSVDVILCLDVLEHLVNPEAVIQKLHQYLAPNGMIIASLPNVRHYSVLIPLLFQNKWEYKESGILDKTHLRFFVKKTAISLMESSGLKLTNMIQSLAFEKSIIANIATLGIFKSFLTWQYLIQVKK